MIVNVSLLRQTLRDAMMIPLEAVVPLEDGYEVYVNHDGRAERRRVSLGLIQGVLVQALSVPADDTSFRAGELGLQPGERLIVKGHRGVGQNQRVAETASPQDMLDRMALGGNGLRNHPARRRSGPPADRRRSRPSRNPAPMSIVIANLFRAFNAATPTVSVAGATAPPAPSNRPFDFAQGKQSKIEDRKSNVAAVPPCRATPGTQS